MHLQQAECRTEGSSIANGSVMHCATPPTSIVFYAYSPSETTDMSRIRCYPLYGSVTLAAGAHLTGSMKAMEIGSCSQSFPSGDPTGKSFSAYNFQVGFSKEGARLLGEKSRHQ